ncbi:MAG: VOC family protein [Gammaproteobacteria bacterium]|nr:VOC family protein [Gammaproteobacteria bacterium]
MIGYVTVGTNDKDKASAFYDELLALLGATRIMNYERLVTWGTSPGAPMLGIIRPYDGKEACVGNGTMIALQAPDHATVDKLYEKALALGAADEGAPGPRGQSRMYFAYARDMDGNKLAFYSP